MTEYYVSGCVDNGIDIETVEDDVAEFWTLYERDKDGLSQGIVDLRFREDAEAVMAVYIKRDQLQEQVKALAENEGYKQAFYEMAEILGIGARPHSPKNVFEQVMKPMLISIKKESNELADLSAVFDELAKSIGWSRERCEQTGESPMDVAVSLVNLVAELEKDTYPTMDEWAVDNTCGRPILVYKGCSVIEAEDAAYILNLVKKDRAALRAAEIKAQGVDAFATSLKGATELWHPVDAAEEFSSQLRAAPDAEGKS